MEKIYIKQRKIKELSVREFFKNVLCQSRKTYLWGTTNWRLF